MDKKFNGTTVETNGVRSIAGGGTGAATAEQARINLGITGGGVTSYTQLTDKPTLGTAAATDATAYATAAQGDKADSALQPDALTPYRTSSDQDTIDAGKASTSHKSFHATGGADALTPADIGAAASSHSHPLSQLEQSSATNGQVPTWNATTSAWVPQTPSSGVTAHKASHATGGADALTPADIGAIGKNISDSKPVNAIRAISAAQYDALGSPDSNTIYFIL